jgi:amino acid permease
MTEVTSVSDTGMNVSTELSQHTLTEWTRRPPYHAFLNGFHGFCTVFVIASFAYSGTELTGLAAAEAEDPRKEIPKATRQVVWRICIFYIVNLFLIGLIVPANTPLYSSGGSESRHSPFVIAIELAGIAVLPSIFNAVILISVMSVANSCTFGSTRTFQALAQHGKPLQRRGQSSYLTTADRNGPEVVRLRRQEGPSPCRRPPPTSLRVLGVHQSGCQWRW